MGALKTVTRHADAINMDAGANRDKELLEAIALRSDREAFRELFSRHAKTALNLARRITIELQTAEDAVQEAMIRVWKRAGTFSLNEEGNVRAWMLRIVAREAARLARKRVKSERIEQRDTKRQIGADTAPPSRVAERREEVSLLQRCLDDLPPQSQQMMALHFGAGLTHGEIGELLSISRRNVSYKIRQILDELKGRLARAGVAATVPLLEPEMLQEGLCAGTEATETLTDRVMEGLSASGAAIANRPPILNPLGRGPAVLGALGLVGIGLAVGAFAWWQKSESTQPEPKEASAAVTRPFSVRWTFEDGIPGDWIVDEGKTARLRPAIGKKPACLVMEQEKTDALAVTIATPPPKQPLMMTATVFWPRAYVEKGPFRTGFQVFWERNADNSVLKDHFIAALKGNSKQWKRRVHESTHRIRTYLFDEYSMTFYENPKGEFYLNEKDACVIPGTDFVLTSIHKYAKPYPASRLYMGIHGLGLVSVELEQIRLKDLPEKVRHPEKILDSCRRAPETWKHFYPPDEP